MMKKVNQGAQKYQKLIENYELSEAAVFLSQRVFKQKDESKSEIWRDELRRAIARLKLTLNTTDEHVAPLSLPWYGGRVDEFGRIEEEGKVSAERWRGRPNFADPAYWNAYWDQFFIEHGYFTKKYEEVNCEFSDVFPVVETFLVQRAVDNRNKKLAAQAEKEAKRREEAAHAKTVSTAASLAEKAKKLPQRQNQQRNQDEDENGESSSEDEFETDSRSSSSRQLNGSTADEDNGKSGGGVSNSVVTVDKDTEISLHDISLTALVIGNGMSKTPVHLYEAGFKSVVIIDVSSKVVLNLTDRFKEYPGIEVLECDARNLDRFKEGSFDLVVDKGLIDALYTGYVGFKDVDLVNESVCRVLNTGGCFMSICYAPPPLRAGHFEESSTPETKHRFHPWNVKISKGAFGVGDGAGLWIYTMQRLGAGESKEVGSLETATSTSNSLNQSHLEDEKKKELHLDNDDDGGSDDKKQNKDVLSENDDKKSIGVLNKMNKQTSHISEQEDKDQNKEQLNQNNSYSHSNKFGASDEVRILRQAAYKKVETNGGYIDLQVIRDPAVLNVLSRAPRVEEPPPRLTLEEMLSHTLTPEEAVAAQKERQKEIENGTGGGNPVIASEVGWEKNAEALRRGKVDNAAIDGSKKKQGSSGKHRDDIGYLSEKFTATVEAEKEARRRMFALDPIQEVARNTVSILNGESESDKKREGLTDINSLISDLMKGQAELTRLRLERPPQPLEPRGDAYPVTNVEYDKQLREKENEEMRAHRAKMGLDETDLSRPPEKWTAAMLSFVEYVPYGPKPKEETGWTAMDDPNELYRICQTVVRDPSCSDKLQQWVKGSTKVYKWFFSRALEATEDKAPVNLLRQALNQALSEYRPVDIEFIRLAQGNTSKTVSRTKRAVTPGLASSRPSTSNNPLESDPDSGGGGMLRSNKGRHQQLSPLNKSSQGPNHGIGGFTSDIIDKESNSMRTLRLLEEKLLSGGGNTLDGFDVDDDPYGDDD